EGKQRAEQNASATRDHHPEREPDQRICRAELLAGKRAGNPCETGERDRDLGNRFEGTFRVHDVTVSRNSRISVSQTKTDTSHSSATGVRIARLPAGLRSLMLRTSVRP